MEYSSTSNSIKLGKITINQKFTGKDRIFSNLFFDFKLNSDSTTRPCLALKK